MSWDCMYCRYDNFAAGAKCMNCNKYKLQIRAGDWNCICGKLNFAKKDFCIECGLCKSLTMRANIATNKELRGISIESFNQGLLKQIDREKAGRERALQESEPVLQSQTFDELHLNAIQALNHAMKLQYP